MKDHLFRLPKASRLCSQKDIQALFKLGKKIEGSTLILLYLEQKMQVSRKEDTPWHILFVVPKKKVRKAVRRNYLRRCMREAFRNLQHQVPVLSLDTRLLLALIYKNPALKSYLPIKQDVETLLQSLAQRC